MQLIILIER